MPVLDPGGDLDDGPGLQALGLLPLDLVPAAAGRAQQDLPAAAGGVVDVPIVAAAGLEGHVGDRDALGGEPLEVALPDEVLGVGVVLLSAREDRIDVHVAHGVHSRSSMVTRLR